MRHLRMLSCVSLASARVSPWTDKWLNITVPATPALSGLDLVNKIPSLFDQDPPAALAAPLTSVGSRSSAASSPPAASSDSSSTAAPLESITTAAADSPASTIPPVPQSCSPANVVNRTEFRQMPYERRRAFTDAIQCLQGKPPQFLAANDSSYPGVRTRYDEYVATHINYTWNIHGTASFFAWHRFFIFSLEQDLQQHCNYTGLLPYWDWQLDSQAPQDSELFNGNPYSMGSNGAYVANRSSTWLALQDVNFPPGTGGGCVTHGPFANYTINLGPLDSPYGGNVASAFDYNPRCLVRDLNPWFSQRYNTYDNVTDLLLNYSTIADFQAVAQGLLDKNNRFGIHGGGHWLGGGNSALADFHSSPADPIFFLHHAMIDRLWSIWQDVDPSRQNAISGTSTIDNSTPVMTLNDTLPFGLVAPPQRFGDLMNTVDGPFCYRYL